MPPFEYWLLVFGLIGGMYLMVWFIMTMMPPDIAELKKMVKDWREKRRIARLRGLK